MNAKLFKTLAVLFGLVVSNNSFAGYVVTVFNTGSNLFSNPLENGSDTLSSLFDPAGTPTGTTVSLWNPTTASFDTTSTFSQGTWSVDMLLRPGTGALLFSPASFTNVFSGYPLNHLGDPYTETTYSTPPPSFTGPNGVYLLADKEPVTDTGTDVFLYTIGRLPVVGEKVSSLTSTSTYLGNNTWDSVPILNYGSAAFLTLTAQPIPEPGTVTIGLLGLAVAQIYRRFQS